MRAAALRTRTPSTAVRTVILAGLFAAFAPALALSTGCNKDEPKKVPQEEKKATPVPSDMVFNDFLPQTGGQAPGLAVRVDGGTLEAGVVEAAGDGGAAGGSAATEEAASKLKVVEPGAEPRAVRKYTFTANRTDKRVLTVRRSISAQGQNQEQPPLMMTVEFVPKEVKPTGTRFEMKMVKVDLADKEKLDPRLVQAAAQELGMFTGLTGSFEVNPRGEPGEVSINGSEKMQREGAAAIVDAFQQVVDLILAPLPDAPIGAGAKWEMVESSNEESSKRTLELKELTPEGGTIVSTIEKTVPKRPYPDPRMRGAMMEVHASGTYTYAFRFDHIATKVTGEQLQTIKLELPSPDGKAKKEAATQEAKIKHLLETPAK